MPPRAGGRSMRREYKYPHNGFRRRASWYDNGQRSFRLRLTDEFYEQNFFFFTQDKCRAMYDAFIKLSDETPLYKPGQPIVSCVKRVAELVKADREEAAKRRAADPGELVAGD